jgi:hypothetical protein
MVVALFWVAGISENLLRTFFPSLENPTYSLQKELKAGL